jgi:hypothetical protein
MKDTKQVLAFIIDQEELKRNLNLEYVKEVLRVAEVEHRDHIEGKSSGLAWTAIRERACCDAYHRRTDKKGQEDGTWIQ